MRPRPGGVAATAVVNVSSGLLLTMGVIMAVLLASAPLWVALLALVPLVHTTWWLNGWCDYVTGNRAVPPLRPRPLWFAGQVARWLALAFMRPAIWVGLPVLLMLVVRPAGAVLGRWREVGRSEPVEFVPPPWPASLEQGRGELQASLRAIDPGRVAVFAWEDPYGLEMCASCCKWTPGPGCLPCRAARQDRVVAEVLAELDKVTAVNAKRQAVLQPVIDDLPEV